MDLSLIKLLNEFDLPRAMEIARLKPRSGGTLPLSDDQFEEIHKKYFLGNGVHFALGYIEDNQLISWIGFGLHENKARGKFWYVSFLYTSRFHNYFSFNNPEIGSLIRDAFVITEKLDYYEYYYTISKKFETLYDRQWTKNKFVKTGRYDLEIIGEIPANTQPTIDLYWRLIGKEVKPDTMVIKKRILRPEFRNK
jgi:hypothetical protein